MKKINEDTDQITISVSKSDLLSLANLINWLVDEHNYMDKAKLPMAEEAVEPAINKWNDFLDDECLGFAKGYDIE